MQLAVEKVLLELGKGNLDGGYKFVSAPTFLPQKAPIKFQFNF